MTLDYVSAAYDYGLILELRHGGDMHCWDKDVIMESAAKRLGMDKSVTCNATMYFEKAENQYTVAYSTYDGKRTGLKQGYDAVKIVTDAIEAVADTEEERYACAAKYISSVIGICGDLGNRQIPDYLRRAC